ncbi:hypothetical protein HPB51_007396 [Rhipicephalus microplus]|uniref:Uncharacterized protein n=1 Tax=Rhipicephalus microplus TaxID=6941 RepID=A0A9J6EYA7_RHIMP|nr:hypothetical protein HPB51_007396 [Rhipicephalus microplus]
MTETAGASEMHPKEDGMSSSALEPPVPCTQESLAQATEAPVSSHIPPPAPHQPVLSEFDVQDTPNHFQQSSAGVILPIPDCLQALVLQGEADRQALMQDFETRFVTHSLSLEATLTQRAPTMDVVTNLGVRLSVIEEQSGLQQRTKSKRANQKPVVFFSVPVHEAVDAHIVFVLVVAAFASP